MPTPNPSKLGDLAARSEKRSGSLLERINRRLAELAEETDEEGLEDDFEDRSELEGEDDEEARPR